MEGHGWIQKKGLWANLMVVVIISLSEMEGVRGRNPVLHRVGGGRYTWAPNINFTQWASHEVFYVGDWLYFGFDKHHYNVLQVNKTSYDACEDKDFIANITRGGRDVYNLTQAKPYYFLSGRGGCSQGMKLAISVKEAPLPDRTLPHTHILPKTNGCSPLSLACSAHVNDPVFGAAFFVFLSLVFMS
ncbi:lamin-like protein [Punica granatum]|uniref:Lamin-like protein n=1 Tax=Punica granatum TaxID=22663 RepID=A0A6P8DM82_PUNGR|nr:lamin-like protein [Punica granatum]